MIQKYCINYGELSKADFDGGLVMYEDYLKLEKELADYKDWMTEPIVKFQTEFQEMKKELADLREATRWRAVEDELPESKGSYLVMIGNQDESTNAYYTGIENRWEISSFATHWMPLPKAKQEGAE